VEEEDATYLGIFDLEYLLRCEANQNLCKFGRWLLLEERKEEEEESREVDDDYYMQGMNLQFDHAKSKHFGPHVFSAPFSSEGI